MLNLRTISIKNIKTHPVRTIILFILTFAQLVCVFGGIEMYLGMRQELSMAQERLGADLLVYPTAATSRISTKSLLMQGTPVEVYKERSMLSRMDSCENITAVSYQLYISDTPANGDKIWIFGIEPETDFVISPWLPGGSSSLSVNGNVAVGSKVELTEDQRVILYQQEWPVSEQLMETGSVLDESVFVSMDTLKQMIEAAAALGIDSYSSIDPSSYFSAALVRVDDKSKVGSVTDWINIYVRKVTAVHSEETLTQAASGIQGTSRTMAVIALLAWLLLLVVLGIVYSMLMKERIREIYVWYCVGASRKIVNRVMLSEAFLIHLAGAVAGCVVMSAVFALFGGSIIQGFSFTFANGILTSMAAILVTLIAGLAASYLAVRSTVKKLNGQMLLTV